MSVDKLAGYREYLRARSVLPRQRASRLGGTATAAAAAATTTTTTTTTTILPLLLPHCSAVRDDYKLRMCVCALSAERGPPPNPRRTDGWTRAPLRTRAAR